MKIKLISANWNAETGRSDVTISTRYGQFSAHAQVAKGDEEYASRFLGCEIAEQKAVIKALKVHLQKLRLQYNEVWHIWDMLDQSIYLGVPKCIYARMKELENKIHNTEANIGAIQTAIDVSVEKYIEQRQGKNK